MVVTEEEASGIICPKLSAADPAPGWTMCKGSACMWWLWFDTTADFTEDNLAYRRGYCGILVDPGHPN